MRLLLTTLLLFTLMPLSALAQNAEGASSSSQTAEDVSSQSPSTANAEIAPQSETQQPATPVLPAATLKTDAPAERPSAGLSLGKMALSLAIVVAIVLALGWAFKKLTLRLPGSRHIKIISTMPLGPKERLLVIEMQGKQRVLGVTAHSINLLFELENPLPEEKLASDFHTQLQSFLKK